MCSNEVETINDAGYQLELEGICPLCDPMGRSIAVFIQHARQMVYAEVQNFSVTIFLDKER